LTRRINATPGHVYHRALANEIDVLCDTLECPCCGDDGAVADQQGLFYDGQPLVCGCPGWVTVDDDCAWINNGDEECLQCANP
jgi:hypothetical protein